MNSKVLVLSESKITNIIFDLISLSVITLTPALSHLTSIPLYLLEPMRIMLIVTLLHTSRKNAYVLAFVLPLFSLLISNHPSLIKTILIAAELSLNVYLFFLLITKINNKLIATFISILLSKLFYYTVKFILISSGLMKEDLVNTPLYIQLLIAFILSIYTFWVLRKRELADSIHYDL